MRLRPITSQKLSQLLQGLDLNPLSQRCTLDLQDLLVSLVEKKYEVKLTNGCNHRVIDVLNRIQNR